MKLTDILSYVETLAPHTFQEDYDNSGLILGNPEAEVSSILVCLDVDQDALNLAVEKGCHLIISHHPAIFKAAKVFTQDTREGRLLVEAIKKDIALYSAHTNFDSALGGLTDLLCKKIGLRNIEILKESSPLKADHGSGRYGNITPVGGEEFIKDIKSVLSLDVVRTVGKIPESISRVAVYNGSYDRDILPELCALNPEALITGDLKYHDAQELLESGIFTLDAGHYGTEKLFVDELAKLLKAAFPHLNILSYEGTDVFCYR